jgi:hypothetical protein
MSGNPHFKCTCAHCVGEAGQPAETSFRYSNRTRTVRTLP